MLTNVRMKGIVASPTPEGGEAALDTTEPSAASSLSLARPRHDSKCLQMILECNIAWSRITTEELKNNQSNLGSDKHANCAVQMVTPQMPPELGQRERLRMKVQHFSKRRRCEDWCQVTGFEKTEVEGQPVRGSTGLGADSKLCSFH